MVMNVEGNLTQSSMTEKRLSHYLIQVGQITKFINIIQTSTGFPNYFLKFSLILINI